MNYPPENELGVVFLFSRLARKLGFEIDEIRPFYPDCIAYRDNKRVRIEFEYRSSNFARHRHDPKKCDYIVCWVHDWPAAPLPVLELRDDFGLGGGLDALLAPDLVQARGKAFLKSSIAPSACS